MAGTTTQRPPDDSNSLSTVSSRGLAKPLASRHCVKVARASKPVNTSGFASFDTKKGGATVFGRFGPRKRAIEGYKTWN